MDYVEVEFVLEPLEPARDMLLAELSELPFESFVDTDTGLLAYVNVNEFDEASLAMLRVKELPGLSFLYEVKTIADKNWNEEWEKNYDLVVVENRCLIRAPFHRPAERYEYEIEIEPKMSFGTGHHATTYQMVAEMMRLDFENKTVLDMGCGSAVLAILAEKRGAARVDAIDIDQWAFENSVENTAQNGCQKVNVFLGDASTIADTYHIILANINRNILLADMDRYFEALLPGGVLLLSGFYSADVPLLLEKIGTKGRVKNQTEREGWCMLRVE